MRSGLKEHVNESHIASRLMRILGVAGLMEAIRA